MAAYQTGTESPGEEEGPDPAGQEPSEPVPDSGFLPSRPSRRPAESAFVRAVATAGVIGIGTALGAGLSAGDAAGWVVGIVVSFVCVVLAAILWRSRIL